MANFRLERLFLMLDGPVPGLDPRKPIDAVEFAWHNSNQLAESLGVASLDTFTFAPFEEPEWNDASEGLSTVRALRSQYTDWITKGSNPYQYSEDVLAKKSAVLQKVDEALTAADALGRRFYLAARDLE